MSSRLATYAATATVVLWCCASLSLKGGEFRSIDGSGNNVGHPTWGQAGTQFLRMTTVAYADGISEPRGGDPSTLPSARAISNAVSPQSVPMPNRRGASDWLWQWGQFLDHDLDFTPVSSPPEPFNVAVPANDPFFDPSQTGTQEIGLTRSRGVTSAGRREQINEITAYIDGSMVYGSDAARAAALRGNSGMLATTLADNGEVLPMRNTAGLPNDGGTGNDLFLAGDVRANEQIGLTAAHTLFVREHNRIAAELGARLDAGEPDLTVKRDDAIANNLVSDQDSFIYESARKLVGAQIQKITYEEFLPTLLGTSPSSTVTYDANVDASISNEFATAAFRVGHTLLSPTIKRLNADGTPAAEGNIALRDAFFNPTEVQLHGVDSLLLGLADQAAQEVDTRLVDDVRNFLFGPPGSGGFDLASLNIQRGRDHGLESLNAVRGSLGLATHADFNVLAGGDTALADALASVYDDVDDVDLWLGGLAEVHVGDGLVGETFATIIEDQFIRNRDGDRFFYTNTSVAEHLSLLDPDFETTQLSDIILRNTSIASIQANVFMVPEPSSLAMLVLGCVPFWRRQDPRTS